MQQKPEERFAELPPGYVLRDLRDPDKPAINLQKLSLLSPREREKELTHLRGLSGGDVSMGESSACEDAGQEKKKTSTTTTNKQEKQELDLRFVKKKTNKSLFLVMVLSPPLEVDLDT